MYTFFLLEYLKLPNVYIINSEYNENLYHKLFASKMLTLHLYRYSGLQLINICKSNEHNDKIRDLLYNSSTTFDAHHYSKSHTYTQCIV